MTSAPGPTEVAAWQRQTISPTSTISATGAGVNQVATSLYNMSKAERQQIALALKNAGYKVPTNGIFSDKLLGAYQTALQAAQLQASQLGQQFSSTYFTNYLTNEAAANAAISATTGPQKRVDVRIVDDTTAKALIDTVIEDQLGRKATASEIKRYTTALRKAQQAAPVTTTYTTVGGTTTSKTTGGINEQQYLIDQVAGTDEAKANKVLGFYETFMNALGRD
jgi:hypothetical protein